MSTLPQNSISFTVENIQKTPLSNEEIIELIAFISQGETALPYRDLLEALHDKYVKEIEMRPLNVELLSLRENFPLRVLNNYFEATKSEGFETLILDTIKGYQDDPNAVVYIQRLEQTFGYSPDVSLTQDILQYLEDSEMKGVGIRKIQDYYRDHLTKIADYAPIPDYIREFNIQVEDLPRLTDPEITVDLPDRELAQLLLGHLGDLNIVVEAGSDESEIDILTENISKMSDNDREDLVKKFQVNPEKIEELRFHRDIFRVYGPVNPYPDTDFSQLRVQNEPDEYTNWETFELEGDYDVDVIFGGARMFTDMRLEYDYDNNMPMDNWFVGYCYQCNSRIRAYHHAVREPNLTGGWKGCFCSWPCVRKFMEVDTEHDPDLLPMYQLKIQLTKEIEEQMKEIGIEDRDYEDEDETEREGIFEQDVDQDVVDDITAKLPQIHFETPVILAPPSPGAVNVLL